MHGPFVPLQVIPRALARCDLIAREPEVLASGSLEVVPDGVAVRAEEFVPRNLHVHRTPVNSGEPAAVGPDGPDAIDLVPGTFVAEQDETGVRRRELHVVEPVRRAMDHLALA